MSANSTSLPLYTDEDVDNRLANALVRLGFDVLSCHQAGNSGHGHTDEWQISFATEIGRPILTHNIGDYWRLAQRWAEEERVHAGIILVPQGPLSDLITRAAVYLARTSATDIFNATVWLP